MGTNIVLEPAIDSFRLSIPFQETDVKSTELISRHSGDIIEVDQNTGEKVGVSKGKRVANVGDDHTITTYDITTRFGVGQYHQKFVEIGCSSKLLGEQYFDGITSKTIERVYDSVLDQGIIDLTWESFLGSNVYDLDLRLDFVNEAGEQTWENIRRLSKKSSHADNGYLRFPKRGSITGLQYSNRTTGSPISKPFVKVYNKHLHSVLSNDKGGMNDYCRYWNIQSKKGLTRIEGTLKNVKHMKHYNLERNTLNDVISIGSERIEEIVSDMLGKHLEPTQRKLKGQPHNVGGILAMAGYLMSENRLTYKEIIDIWCSGYEEGPKRRYQRNKLEQIYNEHISNTDVGVDDKFVTHLFEKLGVW